MSPVDTIAEVSMVRDHIQAFSRKDWDAWKKTVAPDAIYEEAATHRSLAGRENIMAGLQTWTMAFPDLHATITNALASGNEVMAEITWEGTQTGPLMGPMGAFPATGKRGAIRAVEVFVFEEGLIKRMRHYFDMMDILRQMGALPEMPAAQR